MPQSTTEFNVLMLGSRGAGKTTLLAVMWEQLGKAISAQKGYFKYAHEASMYFGHALGELRRMYDAPGTAVSPGISGTNNPKNLSIDLHTANHAIAHLRLNFWDYPGGLLTLEQAKGPEAEEFQQQLANAHYFFVVVDAPALLEHDGMFHAIRNYPYPIQSFLHNRLRSSSDGARILFVVTKCEKYIREGRTSEICDAVRRGYDNLLSDIAANPRSSADICLVQTLGTVELDKLEIAETSNGDKFPRYYFKKVSQHAVHSPQNTSLPLKLMLDKAMQESIDRRRASYDGLNWVRDLLGRDDELRDLLNHMRDLSNRASDQSLHLSLQAGQ